jgi:alpha-1,6-mannosyltransferase
LFNGYLIWRLLRTSEHRNKLTLAYLINPALLNEQVCNAHIDVFLTTALIVMIGGLYYRQYTIALLAAVTGFLTKTLPLIWLPLIVGFLIRRKQWQPLMLAASITCVVIGGFSLAVFPNFAAWRSLINPGVSGMLARSLYHAIDLLINNFLGLPTSIRQLLINPLIRLGYLVFLFYYVWVLTQPFVKARYSETKLVIDIGWVTLVLFLVATPWLMPWHTTILLPIACLSLNAPLFFVTSFVFGLSPQMVVGTGSGGSSLSLLTSFLTIGPAIAVLWLGIKFPQLRQKFDFLNSG